MLSVSSFASTHSISTPAAPAKECSNSSSASTCNTGSDITHNSHHHHRQHRHHHHHHHHHQQPQLDLIAPYKLSQHRRAKSDCFLHAPEDDGDSSTAPSVRSRQELHVAASSALCKSASCSRSTSPLPSVTSSALLTSEDSCSAIPCTLPLLQAALTAAAGGGKNIDLFLQRERRKSGSRGSIPEIFVSEDFESLSSSPSSGSPRSLDHYMFALGLDRYRKKAAGAGGNDCASKTAGGASSSRRRSPMTSRRAIIADTPPLATGSSTPHSGRARAQASGGPPSDITSQEDWEASGAIDLPQSSSVSNGSGEMVDTSRCVVDTDDSTDGRQQQIADKVKEVADHLQAKIAKTKDLLKQEQKVRDDNVNEYLKCSASADKQQLSRIKAVFEKRNQKSATSIQQLQKKLDSYQKRLQDLHLHPLQQSHRQPKEVLRDMGQGLRSGLISKPREFAHLIKNKFGSADNIKEILSDEDKDEERTHHGSATLPPGVCLNSSIANTPTATAANCFSSASPQANVNSGGGSGHHSSGGIGGGGGSSAGGGGAGSAGSEEGSECNSSFTSESIPGHHRHHHHQLVSPRPIISQEIAGFVSLDQVISATQETHTEINHFREEIITIKGAFMAESAALHERLAEERSRVEQLEQQVNDLTELHQNEMENLKTTMTDMEEKVQYQSEERVRDLQEMLENFQTRISRMEHQQAQQQQQFLTLEGLENSTARALFVKLINIILIVLQVLLLVVATAVSILAPLLQTRHRVFLSLLIAAVSVMVYLQWPFLKQLYWSLARQYSWIT